MTTTFCYTVSNIEGDQFFEIDQLQPHQLLPTATILEENQTTIFTPFEKLDPDKKYLFLYCSDGTDEEYNIQLSVLTPMELQDLLDAESDWDEEHEDPTRLFSILPFIENPTVEQIQHIQNLVEEQIVSHVQHFASWFIYTLEDLQ